MRIGIVTLTASNNCGSLLQAYALKILLEQYGEVDVINFSSDAAHKIYDIPRLINPFKHPRTFVVQACFYPRRLKESREYEAFRKRYLNILGREYFRKDLATLKNRYDVVVAGSDQVWNVMMRDFDEAFLCGWFDAKKVAYAPSLGGHDIRESQEWQRFAEYINKFSWLSSRERFGKRCIEEITGREVAYVLDPTLTVNTEAWIKLIGKPMIKGSYIFFYSWAYNDQSLVKIVSEQKEKADMPVYVLDSRKWSAKKLRENNFILSKEQGPLAFLNLMYYAERCYVESFHGMIFAYLFQKNFWLLDWHQNLGEMDRRLSELVDLLGMDNRILTPYNYYLIDQSANLVYQKNDRLLDMLDLSRNYLDKALL